MVKRTIEISERAAHLAVRVQQLQVQFHDSPPSEYASIPCEDIGVLLVDQRQTTYSHACLTEIAAHGGVLIVCGPDHLPAAVMLPLADHGEVVWRATEQINALQRRTLCKRLWKQIVQAKIHGQAANLDSESAAHRRLRSMVREVRSGDSTNVEAQAARVYWSAWAPDTAFRRNSDGTDPLNSMLNYGYAVVRAAVARAIVAAGYLPMLGLHHRNRSNAFCLADDLLEPLRPMVDRRVAHLYRSGLRELNRTTKAGLLQVLADPVLLRDQRGPLMVNLHRMVASLGACFRQECGDLDLIEPCR